MGFFLPQTLRSIQEFVNNAISKWDALTQEEKESGNFINPDEPIVLTVPNPNYDEDYDDEYEEYYHFHIQSHGGGSCIDEDGDECGHDGAEFIGMEIDARNFFFNGRRHK